MDTTPNTCHVDKRYSADPFIRISTGVQIGNIKKARSFNTACEVIGSDTRNSEKLLGQTGVVAGVELLQFFSGEFQQRANPTYTRVPHCIHDFMYSSLVNPSLIFEKPPQVSFFRGNVPHMMRVLEHGYDVQQRPSPLLIFTIWFIHPVPRILNSFREQNPEMFR